MSETTRDHSLLLAAIDSRIKKVHTTALDLSFNELLDMHQNQELNISPDYQRLFRWSPAARSRFIESLILEMPVPPIYVIEEDEGRYSLIDGLQRISSYLHFRGQLDAPHLEVQIGDFLELDDCDIVPELNGYKYSDLSAGLQIKLKRSFIRVEVVRKGSDARFKYHMFKRLNTGGALLSLQQVRNCTIRLLDPRFNDFINELAESDSFKKCTDTLTTEKLLAAFNQELVLRFFAFKNYRNRYRHDVGDFLTEYMEAVSDPDIDISFDYEVEKKMFDKVFTLLTQTLGEHSFAWKNIKRGALERRFSVYHYEAITVGLASLLENLDIVSGEDTERLKNSLLELKDDPSFDNITKGGGKNARPQLEGRIEYVTNHLRTAFQVN